MDFVSLLATMSMNDLYKAQDLLKTKIKIAEKEHKSIAKSLKIEDYVSVHKDYVQNSSNILVEELIADIECLNMKNPSTGTSAKWLTADNEPYSWSSKRGVIKNDPVPLDNSAAIKKLMENINKDLKLDLNSCLITHFRDGKAAIRLHDDNEAEMDDNSPICVVTIGTERPIEFLSKYQNSTDSPLLTVLPKEGSLYTMEVGCQEFFKHRVPSTNLSGERYSLSFRKKISPYKLVVNPVISAAVTSINSLDQNPLVNSQSQASCSSSQHQPDVGTGHGYPAPVEDVGCSKPRRKRTTVLFGTSITSKLPRDGLAGRGRKFINVSQSGARIEDISNLVDNFHDRNPSALDVEKIILSFGTNDIKYDSSKAGVSKLRVPIGNLIAKVKHLFPDAIILIQCVLPLRNLYWYTSRNVLGLNRLLYQLCLNYNCVFIDIFRDFLSADARDHNRNLFYDHFHLNFYGRKVLCYWLHNVINRSSFNRVVY